MSLSEYFDTYIAPANQELGRLLYDRSTKQVIEIDEEN